MVLLCEVVGNTTYPQQQEEVDDGSSSSNHHGILHHHQQPLVTNPLHTNTQNYSGKDNLRIHPSWDSLKKYAKTISSPCSICLRHHHHYHHHHHCSDKNHNPRLPYSFSFLSIKTSCESCRGTATTTTRWWAVGGHPQTRR